jgi:Fic family protein
MQAFGEGNYRTGRIVQDILFMRSGYPPISLTRSDSKYKEYEKLGYSEDKNYKGTDPRPFMKLMTELIRSNMEKVGFP